MDWYLWKEELVFSVFCSLISVWFDDLLLWLFLLSVIFGILTDVVLSYGTASRKFPEKLYDGTGSIWSHWLSTCVSRLNSVDFELLNTLVPPLLGSYGVLCWRGTPRASSTLAATDITYRTLLRCCIVRSMWCVRRFLWLDIGSE